MRPLRIGKTSFLVVLVLALAGMTAQPLAGAAPRVSGFVPAPTPTTGAGTTSTGPLSVWVNDTSNANVAFFTTTVTMSPVTRFSVGDIGRNGGASGEGQVSISNVQTTNGAGQTASIPPSSTIIESTTCTSYQDFTNDPANNQFIAHGNAANPNPDNYRSVAIDATTYKVTFDFNRLTGSTGDGSFWDLFVGLVYDDSQACSYTPVWGLHLCGDGDGVRTCMDGQLDNGLEFGTKTNYNLFTTYHVSIVTPLPESGGGCGSNCPPPQCTGSPTASLSANPTSGLAPLAVKFSASGTVGPNCTLTGYSLDFGDGSTAKTGTSLPATISHTYTTVGSFEATLTVTQGDGQTATATQTIVVDDKPVVGNPTVDPSHPVCNPLGANALECDDPVVTVSVSDGDGDLVEVDLCIKVGSGSFDCSEQMSDNGDGTFSGDVGSHCAGTKLSFYVQAVDDVNPPVKSATKTITWSGDPNLNLVYCQTLGEPYHQ